MTLKHGIPTIGSPLVCSDLTAVPDFKVIVDTQAAPQSRTTPSRLVDSTAPSRVPSGTCTPPMRTVNMSTRTGRSTAMVAFRWTLGLRFLKTVFGDETFSPIVVLSPSQEGDAYSFSVKRRPPAIWIGAQRIGVGTALWERQTQSESTPSPSL